MNALILVVICLKNRTFAVSQTTHRTVACIKAVLWFAWKIVLLQYRKQHLLSVIRGFACCDLLEKSYFCSIANNSTSRYARTAMVVICLKNRTFAVSQTTVIQNLLYLLCCDLLEKSYFCSIANNQTLFHINLVCVVICLKNRTFAVSQTTLIAKIMVSKRLWFAWKIVLLQYRKQRAFVFLRFLASCDLLEKSYFCSIANNS